MKKFMWLILLASVLEGSMYGASAEPETITNNPPFYRLRYQQDGTDRHLFILGTAHRLTLSVLPTAVRAHIGEATCLLSELGSNDWKKDPTDAIEILKAQVPVTDCLKSNGKFFHVENDKGWLNFLTPEEARGIEEKLPQHFEDPELAKELYTVCPSETASYLRVKMLRELHPDVTSRKNGMDGALARAFSTKGKTVLALESYATRLESFNRYYVAKHHTDAYYDRSFECSVAMISYLLNTPAETINPEFDSMHEAIKGEAAEYNSTPPKDFPEDLWTNYRNQYWIENTLRQIFTQEGVGLIAVGQAHLDMGLFPDMGKTGLLNFFESLKQTKKTWHGITIEGIDLWNPAPSVSWTPVDGISTEGPYLERLMASL
jgi:uncharacterized protein YbaP (TraB family)